MEFSEFATNLVTASNLPGFGADPSWVYPSPASVYFWAGFLVVFAAQLLSAGIRWIRGLVGAGQSE